MGCCQGFNGLAQPHVIRQQGTFGEGQEEGADGLIGIERQVEEVKAGLPSFDSGNESTAAFITLEPAFGCFGVVIHLRLDDGSAAEILDLTQEMVQPGEESGRIGLEQVQVGHQVVVYEAQEAGVERVIVDGAAVHPASPT